MKTIRFRTSDLPHERADKLVELSEMDKILHARFTVEGEPDPSKKKTAEQMVEEGGPGCDMARLFLQAKDMKAAYSRIVANECGSFDGGTMVQVYKARGFRRFGFRGRLKDLLVWLKLIEEF